jgi:hypothetical protein
MANENGKFFSGYLLPVLAAITFGVTVWLCSTALMNTTDIAVMKSQISTWNAAICEIKETVREIRKDQVDRKISGYPEYKVAK